MTAEQWIQLAGVTIAVLGALSTLIVQTSRLVSIAREYMIELRAQNTIANTLAHMQITATRATQPPEGGK